MMNVVIVEDEPFAQNELTRLLNQVKTDIEVLAYLESVEEAVEWFTNNEPPQLVFLDIQLSDGLSFDIFNEVTLKAPVIFTTAYDEYAIKAFQLNSIDYLLKPIEKEALQAALIKFEELKGQFTETAAPALDASQLASLLELAQPRKEYKNRIMTKVGDQLRFTKTEDIAYLYAEDNEVLLMTTEGKKSIVDQSLDQLMPLLDPVLFHRVNRGFIVNKNAVGKVHKYFNSRLKIDLIPPTSQEVLISRVKVKEFLDWMEK